MGLNRSALALIACALSALGVPRATHAELHGLYRNARITAMGGAGVALADDEAALYMNPAAMAGTRDMSFHYATGDVDVAGNIYTDFPEIMAAFGEFSPSSVNALMGRNTYLRGQASPTLLVPGFGVGMFMDGQFALYAKNQAFPRVKLGYQQTMGVQAAWGFSTNRARGRRKKGELRFGIGAKALWRRGGYDQLTTAELNNLTNAGVAGLSQFAGNYGLGLGVDLGVQWIRRLSRRFTLHLGASYMNVGDVAFASGADSVPGNFTVGAAGVYETGPMKVVVALDHSHINESVDWRLKNHVGLELRFPALSIYGGVNQVYLTYGVGFDLWLFHVTATSYAEELGYVAFQEPNRRYMVRFGLKFDL